MKVLKRTSSLCLPDSPRNSPLKKRLSEKAFEARPDLLAVPILVHFKNTDHKKKLDDYYELIEEATKINYVTLNILSSELLDLCKRYDRGAYVAKELLVGMQNWLKVERAAFIHFAPKMLSGYIERAELRRAMEKFNELSVNQRLPLYTYFSSILPKDEGAFLIDIGKSLSKIDNKNKQSLADDLNALLPFSCFENRDHLSRLFSVMVAIEKEERKQLLDDVSLLLKKSSQSKVSLLLYLYLIPKDQRKEAIQWLDQFDKEAVRPWCVLRLHLSSSFEDELDYLKYISPIFIKEPELLCALNREVKELSPKLRNVVRRLLFIMIVSRKDNNKDVLKKQNFSSSLIYLVKFVNKIPSCDWDSFISKYAKDFFASLENSYLFFIDLLSVFDHPCHSFLNHLSNSTLAWLPLCAELFNQKERVDFKVIASLLCSLTEKQLLDLVQWSPWHKEYTLETRCYLIVLFLTTEDDQKDLVAEQLHILQPLFQTKGVMADIIKSLSYAMAVLLPAPKRLAFFQDNLLSILKDKQNHLSVFYKILTHIEEGDYCFFLYRIVTNFHPSFFLILSARFMLSAECCGFNREESDFSDLYTFLSIYNFYSTKKQIEESNNPFHVYDRLKTKTHLNFELKKVHKKFQLKTGEEVEYYWNSSGLFNLKSSYSDYYDSSFWPKEIKRDSLELFLKPINERFKQEPSLSKKLEELTKQPNLDEILEKLRKSIELDHLYPIIQSSDEQIERASLQLGLIVSYLIDSPHENKEEGLLSDRQWGAVNFAIALVECMVGIRQYIHEYFNSDSALKNSLPLAQNDSSPKTFKSFIEENIERGLNNLCHSDELLMAVIGELPSQEIIHYNTYLKNVVGVVLHLFNSPQFDWHTHLLPKTLCEKNFEDILTVVFKKFSIDSMIKALQIDLHESLLDEIEQLDQQISSSADEKCDDMRQLRNTKANQLKAAHQKIADLIQNDRGDFWGKVESGRDRRRLFQLEKELEKQLLEADKKTLLKKICEEKQKLTDRDMRTYLDENGEECFILTQEGLLHALCGFGLLRIVSY